MDRRTSIARAGELRALRDIGIVLTAFLGSILLAGLLMAGLVGLMQWAGLLESQALQEVDALDGLRNADVAAPAWFRGLVARGG